MNKNYFAKTPPMGWNSYDYYDTTVTEADIKQKVQAAGEMNISIFLLAKLRWMVTRGSCRVFTDFHQQQMAGDLNH